MDINQIAAGMNNHIWYYRLEGKPGDEVGGKDYLGTVRSVALNAKHVAVLSEGRAQLHAIEGEGIENQIFLVVKFFQMQTL